MDWAEFKSGESHTRPNNHSNSTQCESFFFSFCVRMLDWATKKCQRRFRQVKLASCNTQNRDYYAIVYDNEISLKNSMCQLEKGDEI